MNNRSRFLWVLAAWFGLASAAAILGLPALLPPGGLALLFAWLAFGAAGSVVFHRGVRAWTAGLSVPSLLAPHVARAVGAGLLWLGCRGDLPVEFAGPIGVAEVAAACGAIGLLAAARRRSAFGFWLRTWNRAAFAAVLAGGTAALWLSLHQPGELAGLAGFPLSLLPLLVTPLVIASHVALLDRAGSPLRSRSAGEAFARCDRDAAGAVQNKTPAEAGA